MRAVRGEYMSTLTVFPLGESLVRQKLYWYVNLHLDTFLINRGPMEL